jgi:hypothetical protein
MFEDGLKTGKQKSIFKHFLNALTESYQYLIEIKRLIFCELGYFSGSIFKHFRKGDMKCPK